MKAYDIIIVGGGPAGSSTAIRLAEKGYKVLLLDRQHFPRDKVCGDGVSGKSVRLLKELGLIDEIEKNEHATMYGVIFSNPDGDILEIKTKRSKEPSGYVVRRYVLDNIIFQAAKNAKGVEAREGYTVVDVRRENNQDIRVKAKSENGSVEEFKANIVVGADGASSIVAAKLSKEKIEDEHHVIAVRAYYEGVEGMKDKIELHFIEDVLPGYFWIFPLPGKKANVGIGMLTKELKKKRVDLKKLFYKALDTKLIKPRFTNAKPISELKGWGLPLGSKRRKGYGDNFLLVGDAASLIDPFTGEGIGNALYSGKLATMAINKAFDAQDFSAQTLSYYDELLKQHLDEELQTMYKLQRLGRHKFLLNMAIKKAIRNPEIRELISSTLMPEHSMEYKKKLLSLGFWMRLLLS